MKSPFYLFYLYFSRALWSVSLFQLNYISIKYHQFVNKCLVSKRNVELGISFWFLKDLFLYDNITTTHVATLLGVLTVVIMKLYCHFQCQYYSKQYAVVTGISVGRNLIWMTLVVSQLLYMLQLSRRFTLEFLSCRWTCVFHCGNAVLLSRIQWWAQHMSHHPSLYLPLLDSDVDVCNIWLLTVFVVHV